MKSLLNPKWIFLINSLPLIILSFLFYEQYNIIKSDLPDSAKQVCLISAIFISGLFACNIIYAGYLIFKKKSISYIYGIVSIVACVAFMYWFVMNMEGGWEEYIIYLITFMMLTLAYSLFILVCHFTRNLEKANGWFNFLLTLAVPILWYICGMLIFPLFKIDFMSNKYGVHFVVILMVISSIAFFFFLIRGIYIILQKKSKFFSKYIILWKALFALVFPLLGLFINNGGINMANISFGNFTDPWFYIITIVNALLLCLPNPKDQTYRLVLFAGRCIGFSFTIYFFVTFLPFLPFSIIAILALGIGFLILAPFVLFILHSITLINDFSDLKNVFSKNLILGISVLGFLVIPVIVTINYLSHRSIMNNALEYVDNPDYSNNYQEIDKKSLAKTLEVINDKEKFSFSISYLNLYFSWLVLDNLTLPHNKVNKLEEIFFGESSRYRRNESWSNDDSVIISDYNIESTYNKDGNYWESWLNLELTNTSKDWWNREFFTDFNLPEDCWINDYYLYVNGEKEMGILAEKKSALWIYNSIVSKNRDPGILYYKYNNQIRFKVFPFMQEETRFTGIKFIHKNPTIISFNDIEFKLGKQDNISTFEKIIETEDYIYIPAERKSELDSVQRKPYFHFILDISKNTKNLKTYDSLINILAQGYPQLMDSAKISFTNTYIKTVPFSTDWFNKYNDLVFEGGYFFERAINKILFNEHNNHTNQFPIIVSVSDKLYMAVRGASELDFSCPEFNHFFELSDSRGFTLQYSDEIVCPKDDFKTTVLTYTASDGTIWHLPNNNKPSTILKNDYYILNNSDSTKNLWDTALSLELKWMSYNLHPEFSNTEWRNLVKSSFKYKIMNPLTSYIVVETETQRLTLLQKQKQTLAGNSSLSPDINEDTERMSEPDIIILGILLGGVIYFIERKRRNNKRTNPQV